MATIERQIDRSATTDLPKRKKGENPNKTTNLFHNVTFSEEAEDSYTVKKIDLVSNKCFNIQNISSNKIYTN